MEYPLQLATHLIDEFTIEQDGCCLVRRALSDQTLAEFVAELERALSADRTSLVSYRSQTFGARNLALNWQGWRALVANGQLELLLKKYVGPTYGLVRVLYFDKPPGHGWSLPWHRDQTIAVQRHCQPLSPFSKPTEKAGIPHVEATPEVLQEMLTLRLSIDPMTESNGPLLIIPGSHNDIGEMAAPTHSPENAPFAMELQCDAGDVFIMRPRLLHASREASKASTEHRRVVHMEFAPRDLLPAPWSWFTWLPPK